MTPTATLELPVVDVPGLGRVDVRVGRAAGLPGVVHAPELVVTRVVGRRRDRDDVVRLDVAHSWVVQERLRHLILRSGDDPDEGGVDLVEPLSLARPGLLDDSRLLGGRDAGLEAHDQLVGHDGWARGDRVPPERSGGRQDEEAGRNRHEHARADARHVLPSAWSAALLASCQLFPLPLCPSFPDGALIISQSAREV